VSGPSRGAVDRYVAAVRAKDLDAIEDLFAEDAVLLPPQSEALEGKEAILGYYRDLVFALGPVPTAVRHVEDGATCVVELEAEFEGAVLAFADVFTVDGDGRVHRLAIYHR